MYILSKYILILKGFCFKRSINIVTEHFSNTTQTLKIYQSSKNYKIEEVVFHFKSLPLTFYMALLILHVGIIHLTEDEDKLTPWWFFLSYVKTLTQSVVLLKKTKDQWLLGVICLFKKYLETLVYIICSKGRIGHKTSFTI